MFIKNCFNYTTRNDLAHLSVESIWVEFKIKGNKPFLINSLYRPPSAKVSYFYAMVEMTFKEDKHVHSLGDFNIDYKMDESLQANPIFHIESLCNMKQLVDFPMRVTLTTSTTIDLILTNNPDSHMYT